MITDEQIRDLWSWSATREAEQTATTQQHAFARKLIALAQQIKPLEWVEVSDALKVVKTVFGEYGVFISGSVTSAKFAGDDYYSRLFSTEAEAIAAANEDYQRRVLSCLAWGRM